MHVSFYLGKVRNCEGPDRSPQSGATELGLEYLPRATNSFLSLQYDLSTVRCQIQVHKVNFKAKIMLIFNTYNTLNLKEKILSINKAYVWIHHYPTYLYKCSENFTTYWRWLPSKKTKMAKFAISSSLKQLS